MTPAFERPIYVTRPLLPELNVVYEKLQEIWDARWLTNGGAQHRLLEVRLKERLGASYLTLFNNGTSALIAAVRCLELTGEVITTPFTFAATPHSIVLGGASPVFCDIDPSTMNINPDCIEELITPRTSAIMAVHVYGQPCDVVRIDAIARKHNLRVIYDAAHAFDSTVEGGSVARFGDVSAFSFHATKMFHTVEGGALAFADERLKRTSEMYKNFGISDEECVDMVGMNGKMNEVQAAIGLAVLDCMTDEVIQRTRVVSDYVRCLSGVPGITLPADVPTTTSSPCYFPIRIDEELFGTDRDGVYELLRQHNVFSRKYFYPLCSDFAPYRELPSSSPSKLPVATRVARQVLCLPLYGSLSTSEVEQICELVVLAAATCPKASRWRIATSA